MDEKALVGAGEMKRWRVGCEISRDAAFAPLQKSPNHAIAFFLCLSVKQTCANFISVSGQRCCQRTSLSRHAQSPSMNIARI